MTPTHRSQESLSFQDIVSRLSDYWVSQDCTILSPYDMEVGAGTFHPTTTLYCLGPQPWRFAHVQPSRRPTDGRYGDNPNRAQRFHQFQVVLKPSPENVQQLFLDSLASLGIDASCHDIRFLEDDWEGPTLGASGLGWEVWCDGMEIAQFTYLQQLGGVECQLVSVELAYGLDRIALFVQHCDSLWDVAMNRPKDPQWQVHYRDLFHEAERQFSIYHFEQADTAVLHQQFEQTEREAHRLLGLDLPLPAYDLCLKASHLFNILQARGVISVTERAAYIARVRGIAKGCCQSWLSMIDPTAA